MPKVQVTTKSANSVWRSPDGQREIFEVMLDYNGQLLKAKTYSSDISRVGWAGEVESYEKDGKYGSETYVKQPAKEGFQQGGGSTAGYASRKPAFTPGKPQDQYTMFLSYAKDIIVAMQNTSGFDMESYNQLLAEVVRGGNYLYEHRPGGNEAAVDLNKLDTVVPVPDGAINLDGIDKMFPGNEPYQPNLQEEKPWGEI